MAAIPDGWELIEAPEQKPEPGAFDLDAAADFGRQWGTVTSTDRTPEHNRRVGGVENSFHLTTRPGGPRALDIARRRGVRHVDIEAAYRDAGYDLIESLDEGDHSHFAFRSGPQAAQEAAQSDVPEGWELVQPEPQASPAALAGTLQPQSDTPTPNLSPADHQRGANVGPAPAAPKTLDGSSYRTATDPAVLAKAQAAFDRGASVAELMQLVGETGHTMDIARVRASVAYRDKHGKSYRAFVPVVTERFGPLPEDPIEAQKEAYRRRGLPEPSISAVDPNDRTIPERVRDFGSDLAGLLGHSNPYAVGEKFRGSTDFIPLVGGGAAIEEGAGEFGQGNLAGGTALMALGSLDFIPGVGIIKGIGKKAGKEALEGAGREGAEAFVRRGTAQGQARVWSPEAGPQMIGARYGQPLEPTPRSVDRIDVADVPPGWVPANDPVIGRTRPMGEQATPEEIAALANRINPEDVTPIPANAVESLEEFNRIGEPRPALSPPNPADELAMRTIGNRNRRGPLDLVSWVRSQPWALKDEGGELAQYGITNAPRKDLDFARDEGFLGRLVDNEAGVSLDDAADAAWRAGFFPNHTERPSIAEFLDVLADTHRGGNRAFRMEDLDEVARFNAARSQADTIRSAGEQGITYAQDISRPIGPGDLLANQPPPSAYEDLVRAGGRVANINLDKIETRHDIRRALQNVELRFGGFDAARRGQITQEQTAALAAELRLTPDDLLKRRKGQALNAEQAFASRQILAKSLDELTALASRAKGGSDTDLLAFRKGLIRHAAIQEQVSGATAEAGRALGQFRMLARSKAVPGHVLELMIEQGGGRGGLEDAAQAIIDMQRDPARMNAFVRTATNPRFRDKYAELYINGLLSTPATHVVNVVSNALTAIGQIPEFAAAATIGAGRRAFNLGAAERVTYSEVGARAVGMMTAVPDGLKEAWRVFRTEQPRDWVSRIETGGHQNIKGMKGRLIRIPSRAMMAGDEVFKAIARESNIRGLAVRKAHSEGVRGDALKARAAELAANPTDEMIEKSFEYGRYVTFQSKLGSISSGLLRAANEYPFPLKSIFPFIRTPTNLAKFAIERSPFAPVLKRWRDDVRAGGARRDLAIAKVVVASGFGYFLYERAQDGGITGSGPADPNARKLMMADGWQPYSVKIGDTYVSYSRMDPFATTFGIAADFGAKFDHMTEKQRENAAVILTASVMQQMEDKFWLSGVSDFMRALDEPERFGETWAAGVAGSFVPAIVGNAASTVDPVRRDTRHTEGLNDWFGTPLARIKSRIPGLSDNLPARVDMWGRTLPNDPTRVISPFRSSTERRDPISEEMLRVGARFGNVKGETDGIRHTVDQQAAYEQRAGSYVYEDLGKAMADPQWPYLTDDEKRKWVDEIKEDARRAAREELGLGKAAIPPGWEAAPQGWELVP